MILGSLIALMFLSSALAKTNPVICWKFDQDKDRTVIDSMSRTEDEISGNYKYTNGAIGKAIKFDGYTTSVIRKAAKAPQLADRYTVEAWVALQAYPWNWTAIVNQEKDHKAGYFFGIDAEGHLGLHMSVDNRWCECTSKNKLPLLKWSHIAGTFDKDRGINIYVNGKPAGSLAKKGQMTPV
jgi:hypothetical protein